MQSIKLEDFNEDSCSPHLQRLSRALNSSKRIVAITGAGISVTSGIPVIL